MTAVLGDSGALPGHGGCAATEAKAAPPAAAEVALQGWEVAALASDQATCCQPSPCPACSSGTGQGTASSQTVEAEGDQLRRAQRAKGGQTQGSVPSSQLPRYLPHRLLPRSAALRSYVQAEGRRLGKATGAASGGGPPFGHPLKCWERPDSPEPRRDPFTGEVRTQAPKLLFKCWRILAGKVLMSQEKTIGLQEEKRKDLALSCPWAPCVTPLQRAPC